MNLNNAETREGSVPLHKPAGLPSILISKIMVVTYRAPQIHVRHTVKIAPKIIYAKFDIQ